MQTMTLIRSMFRDAAQSRESFAVKQQQYVDEMEAEGEGDTLWCSYVQLGIALNGLLAEIGYTLAGGREADD